ncbi:hypothetical protein AcW2_006511 [Taiwanofungus camphoratus]|nr:hypothetical protein AcW2_006511 [Antrodia cinnamomea]
MAHNIATPSPSESASAGSLASASRATAETTSTLVAAAMSTGEADPFIESEPLPPFSPFVSHRVASEFPLFDGAGLLVPRWLMVAFFVFLILDSFSCNELFGAVSHNPKANVRFGLFNLHMQASLTPKRLYCRGQVYITVSAVLLSPSYPDAFGDDNGTISSLMTSSDFAVLV